MAILKMKDISKMNDEDLNSKIAELKLELIKANVAGNKTNAKTKEIKKAISRINTAIRLNKSKRLLKEK